MRIVEDPVGLPGQAQGIGGLVGVVLVPGLDGVGFGVPGGGKRAPDPDPYALGKIVYACDGGPSGFRVGIDEVEAGGLAWELLEACGGLGVEGPSPVGNRSATEVVNNRDGEGGSVGFQPSREAQVALGLRLGNSTPPDYDRRGVEESIRTGPV